LYNAWTSLDVENQTWYIFKLATCNIEMGNIAQVMEAASQYSWQLNIFICEYVNKNDNIVIQNKVHSWKFRVRGQATLAARTRQQKGTLQLLWERTPPAEKLESQDLCKSQLVLYLSIYVVCVWSMCAIASCFVWPNLAPSLTTLPLAFYFWEK
jgi:hypothetical protein